jgi:hypothetical protein
MRQPVRADAPRDRESGPGPVGSSGADKPSPPPMPTANRFEPMTLGPAAFAPPMYANSSEEEPSRGRKWLPLLVVLGAAGAGALAIWIAVLINRPPAPTHAASSTNGGSAAVTARKAAPAAKVEKPAAVAEAAPASATNVEAEAKAAPLPGAVAATAAEPGAASAAASTADKEASSSAPLGKAEEEARAKRHAARGAKTAAANLPAAPSRTDVLGAMSKVAPAVQRCMSGTHGIVTADMKIDGATGRVMSANISGAPGSAGSCIAGAVRKAHFPPFSQASIAVRYPMKL